MKWGQGEDKGLFNAESMWLLLSLYFLGLVVGWNLVKVGMSFAEVREVSGRGEATFSLLPTRSVMLISFLGITTKEEEMRNSHRFSLHRKFLFCRHGRQNQLSFQRTSPACCTFGVPF